MENIQNTTENLNELLQVRRDKLKDLQSEGRDPFQITKFERTHTSKEIAENYTEEERQITKRGSEETETIMAKISALDGQIVSVAGRIMSKRGMGKVGFVHIADINGKIQLFVKKDILGEEDYNRFKKLDTGEDLLGCAVEQELSVVNDENTVGSRRLIHIMRDVQEGDPLLAV